MLLGYLFALLSFVGCAICLAVPHAAQSPLHSTSLSTAQQYDVKPNQMGVLLAFGRSGEEHESTIQIPLGVPLKGSVLHTSPFSDTFKPISSLKILSVLSLSTFSPGSAEHLARVRCSVEAKFGVEEKWAATAVGKKLGVWPAFGVSDRSVALDRSESRWFLAGREIERVECW